MMQSVFGMHDRARVEVFCYSLRKDDASAFRKCIEKGAEHFYDVPAARPERRRYLPSPRSPTRTPLLA